MVLDSEMKRATEGSLFTNTTKASLLLWVEEGVPGLGCSAHSHRRIAALRQGRKPVMVSACHPGHIPPDRRGPSFSSLCIAFLPRAQESRLSAFTGNESQVHFTMDPAFRHALTSVEDWVVERPELCGDEWKKKAP